LRNVSNRLAKPLQSRSEISGSEEVTRWGRRARAPGCAGPAGTALARGGLPAPTPSVQIQLVEQIGVGDVPVADGDERTGCLSTLGIAVGTFVVSTLLAVIATVLIGSVPASRIGALLGVVLIPHMVGIGFTRGRIRRGAQLFRIAAAIVAVEVGLVVLLLLLAALTA
jgi:hypothetical protein